MNKHIGILALTVLFLSSCSTSKQASLEELQKEALVKAVPSAIQAVSKPKFILPVGEYMKFSIRWLGLEVGTAEVTVKEIIKIKERDAYHIEVLVRSNRLIDLIWPVRDEHHSYIDTEFFHSLRYDKKVSEGFYRADETMEYDQVNHTARYTSNRSGDIKEMLIPEHVQDQLSCTFWFRAQEMKPGDILQVPVNADEKNWDLEVHAGDYEELNLDGFGKVKAIKAEPFAQFQGMFVRKGRVWGYMSADDRRIPLMMRAGVPKLGSITMLIAEYKNDKIHIKA